MRIGIDARTLTHFRFGGLFTYVSNFIPPLVELARDHEIFIYLDQKLPYEFSFDEDHVCVRYLPWSNTFSSLRNDLGIDRYMRQDRVEVAHFPANTGFCTRGIKNVLTLHDEINILPLVEIIRGHAKDPRTITMMTYLHFQSLQAVRNADMIVTVSEYSRRQIAAHSDFDIEKIVPVHHAPTADFTRIEDAEILAEVCQRHQLDKQFVLADALKNPQTLIEAWRCLAPELKDNREIVFFSRRPNPLPIVFEAVDEGIARLLVRPSRPDLIALFSMADVFVFPSWIEGFGLPILEAMTCGAPVIASDRGSIPEVAQDAALICDAEDIDTMAAYLTQVLSSPQETERLRQLGFARAADFSWKKTARQILGTYERALSLP